ncbi:hypothetical protein GQ457_09G008730 [Hibiscus cannabinus]
MATTSSKLLVAAVIQVVIFLSNFQTVTNEPAVSASPAVLPYVNAPNMSSFFPTEAPPQRPDSEAIATIPSSSEFAEKSSGCSAKLPSLVTQAYNSSGGIKVKGHGVCPRSRILVAAIWSAHSKLGVDPWDLSESFDLLALKEEGTAPFGIERRSPDGGRAIPVYNEY